MNYDYLMVGSLDFFGARCCRMRPKKKGKGLGNAINAHGSWGHVIVREVDGIEVCHKYGAHILSQQ